LCRFRQLGDETTGLDCPRDQVLKLIWHIRPHIFIYENFNWSFSPFFITRFKKAMQLYETMFDLMDTLIPRDNEIRQIIERDMLARDATTLIACEGATLIERPESYKGWHQRMLRAGFEQIPLDPTIVKKCKENLRKFDGSKFFVEEESNWFLQGWRGRILYGHSTWKPNTTLAIPATLATRKSQSGRGSNSSLSKWGMASSTSLS
jgi:GRAS domain family